MPGPGRDRPPAPDAAAASGLPAILALQVETPMAGRVRTGVAWTAGTRVLVQVLQVAATAVLARLLSPGDYGLAAIVAVVTGFAAIMVDLGIGSSVIQRRELDARFLSTAFWMNLAVALTMAGVVCALAVPTARFFDQPQLVGLVLLSSLTLVLSLHAVHVAVLQRVLAFPLLGRMTVVTSVVGMVVAVSAAAAGMGAVSLVLGPVAERLTSVVQVWSRVRWWPRARPSREAARDIWRFGRGLTGYNVLAYWVGSADRFVIGRVVSVPDLGYYNRASNLMMLPIHQTARTLSSVFYPALAAMASDRRRLQDAWLRLVRASWLVGIPVGVGLALAAPALVRTLYGSGWGPVVPILVVLSTGVPFLLLGSTFNPVYQALGRTGLQFRLGLVNAVIALGALAIGIQWGVLGVAVAVVVRSVANVVVSVVVLVRLMDLRAGRLVDSLWRSATASVPMGLAVWGTGLVAEPLPSPAVLALQALAGGVVYGALAWWLERDTVRELLGRRRGRTRYPTSSR